MGSLIYDKCVKPEVDLSGTAFCDVDGTGYAADFITYLDVASDLFRPVKAVAHSLLQLKPGERVLDVGCGSGDDIRNLAKEIAPNGYAVGVDSSQSMIEEARRQSAGCGLPVEFAVGDATTLPWHSDYFDVCRADRVFQHLPDPERALKEMLRVLKRGGRLVVVDRDWGMVTLDASDDKTTSMVLNRVCSGLRNGRMGRKLHLLFKNAQLINIEVQRKSIRIKSFSVADTLLDLRVVLNHAVTEGLVSQHGAAKWLDDLLARDVTGKFCATVMLYIAYGRKK